MNLFLNLAQSHTRNPPSNQFLKNNNKLNLHTVSNKDNINQGNKLTKLSLFNQKGKSSKLLLRKPSDSIQIKEITQTEYSKENTLSPSPSNIKSNDIFTKAFEAKNYHIKNIKTNPIDFLERNNSIKFNSNKILINLKRRYSVLSQAHQNLDQQYGLSAFPKRPRRCTLNESPSAQQTFFTSIPIEKASKRNSMSSKNSYSRLKLRKEYYNAIKLKELKNQVKKFESSEKFHPNEKIIEKYMSSPDRFTNKKINKKINLRKKLKINWQKDSIMSINNNVYTVPITKSNKSKSLYEKINSVHKESDINRINVKYTKFDYNYEKTDKILKNALKRINLMGDEVTEYLKEIALEYKKELGEYTLYNGKGIYTNHLKILKKDDDKLAFLLTNELAE